ncbi:SGNH/GDSL hydrolase family protein [Flavobacterium sp. MR2016-29]|uniref:SGNH/GDSL hydrolase family protein n=1 Tax=Flavobacterium sp. MR2016-29 TaxID=2783795 RepID=UPI00188CF77A|nr:SGNH/GDSL hydrolase family protein [Flavobacterium sp. MR2016-29]MBF4492134.1 SGNH/GDSL hydrolase family protein [Flavobacterium sp. MR2016-29]
MFLKNKVGNYITYFCVLIFLLQSCEPTKDKNLPEIEEKTLVVVLGSSNAYGLGPKNINDSWAGLLKNEKSTTLVNLSFLGSTTYHFLPANEPNYRNIVPDKEHNIEAAIKLSPKIIIFSITTNDIASGYSIDEYLSNMKIMTDLCVANKIEYIVTSTAPRNPLPFERRKALYDLNRELEKIYGERYTEIYNFIADLDSFKWQKNLCISDSIHGNEEAHLIMYREIFKSYEKSKTRLSAK